MPKPPPHPRKLPTDWGRVADWYDSLVGGGGSEYHRAVVLPGVRRLLGEVKGKRILDIACGQGVLCRLLHDEGAAVTGVDAAAELIAAARAHSAAATPRAGEASPRPNAGASSAPAGPATPRGIGSGNAPTRSTGPAAVRPPHYLVGDARELDILPAGVFDAATCVLAVQNIHPLQGLFDSAARRLRSGGALIVVMMHPCFRGAKESSWGWDEQAQTQYRRVDRYLLPRKSPIFANPGKKDGAYTWTFHRPLEDYVKGLRKAGLLLDAVEEWTSHKHSDSGPRAAAENRARKEIPLFMAIRALRVQSSSVAEPASV
jgi:SAM-dependent methyltransferase